MNIQACVDVGKNKKSRLGPVATLSHKDEELLPYVQPTQHHYISGSTCEYSYLATWLREMGSDPAVKVSVLLPTTECY
jgi:hypothetical protein